MARASPFGNFPSYECSGEIKPKIKKKGTVPMRWDRAGKGGPRREGCCLCPSGLKVHSAEAPQHTGPPKENPRGSQTSGQDRWPGWEAPITKQAERTASSLFLALPKPNYPPG